LMMALVGTRTVTDLPDDYDPSTLKEFLAKLLDSLKAKRPGLFSIIQLILITIYSVLTFGGFELGGSLDVVLKVVTMLGVIMTGARTGRFVGPDKV
jgi:hypothetical protein